MSACADPTAPVSTCAVCTVPVHTCERIDPEGYDYACPAHPDGVELSDGRWVCSSECWEVVAESLEVGDG